MWFAPDQALADFWAVYEAHYDEISKEAHAVVEQLIVRASGPNAMTPEARDEARDEMRRHLARAFGGDWGPFEQSLRRLGATFAALDTSFSVWADATGEIQQRLVSHLLRAHGDDPARSAAALGMMQRFFSRSIVTLFDGYLRAKEEKVRAAEREARDAIEKQRLMFERNPLPMWVYDVESLRFSFVNDAMTEHYGYAREELETMTLADIRPPEDVPLLFEDVAQRAVSSTRGVWRHRKKDGSVMLAEVYACDFPLEGKRARLVLANDVTDRLRLEEQLRQSQKMEAIGRLAGGIAHDFNNLLTVILSYGSLLTSQLRPGDPMRDDVNEIVNAGQRAADLTRQLLAFSRQQVVAPKVVDLNDVLRGMDNMLQRIVGDDVDLVSLPTERLGHVRVDPSRFEQVIMNLVVNARDAMPTGGKLTIETANVTLDEAYAKRHFGVKPGAHVMLAVSDTGVGMDAATQSRIFEPFFTTKERGKGTGLGLVMVFGIVQQSGGSLWVYSEVDKGTTFKIYLPRVDAEVDAHPSARAPETTRGTETILLVEDDAPVRNVTSGILRKSGYHVIDVQNAGEALLCSEKYEETIHLLLTDVVMPQVSGPELAKRLASARPNMKVLCMSGFTDDSIVRHGVLEARFAYIQKPLTPESLTRKVREVLNAPDAPTTSTS